MIASARRTKRSLRRTFVAALIATAALPGAGPAAAALPWTLELQGGVHSAWWFTSDDDDGEEQVGHAVDYFVEGSHSLFAAAAVRRPDAELVGLRLARPFAGTNLEGVIVDRAFADLAGLVGPRPGGLLQLAAGLRLEYRRTRMSGRGVAVEDMVLVSATDGEVPLAVGEGFAFETGFEDWYLSLAGFRFENGVVRVGLYHSELTKPHEAFSPNNYVIESRLTGQGAFLQVQAEAGDAILRGGTVQFEPQGVLNHDTFQGDGSWSLQLGFHLNPPLTVIGPPRDGALPSLALVPMVGGLFRADYQNPPTGEEWSAEGELSMDIVLECGIWGVGRF